MKNLSSIRGYALALVSLAVATLLRFLADPWLGNYAPFPLYFAAVTIVGVYAGVGPAILTMVLSGSAANIFFMPPRGQLFASGAAYWLGMGLFYLASTLIIVVAARLRASREAIEESKRQLEERTEQLSIADRRKDDFISMLAHELRNPLAPIVSAVQMLRLKGKAAPEQTQLAIDIIDRQSMQLKFLIDDLLDVIRINTGRIALAFETVEIGKIVRQCVDNIRPRCSVKDLTLVIHDANAPLWLNADPGRLAQIIDNLLDNAVKYTNAGGTIALSLHRENAECVLSITDTGIGINTADLQRIFDAFEQADTTLDRQAGGLGLGLHLVRRLTEKHGGTVTVASEGPGRGSEFIVRLPLLAQLRPESRADRPRVKKKVDPHRILIVDDNFDAAETLAMVLEGEGHDVRVAGSGSEALAVTESFEPEVALVDLGMPDMDGFELADRLRQRFGEPLRLLALTGYAQEEFRLRSLRAGFDDHLIKPLAPEALTDVISAPRPD